MDIVWTKYLKHRALARRFDLAIIEHVLRFSNERYFDTVTQHKVAVRRHGNRLVLVPYEQKHDTVPPVTMHATTQ
jgi:hypothetical protein